MQRDIIAMLTSCGIFGLSAGSAPLLLDEPTTRPPLIPPPATAALKTFGQWSRPAFVLIFGVRPNSPHAITIVVAKQPALIQILNQRGIGAIPARQKAVTHRVETLDMRVPPAQINCHQIEHPPPLIFGRATGVDSTR